MTQIKAYVPGLYARSAEQDRDAQRRDFLSIQRESGIDYLSDGLLDWTEGSAPLAQQVGRTAVPARAATAEKIREPLGEPYFRVSEMPVGRWISTLPSPLALAHYAGISAPQAAESILSPQVEWLAENGCAFVVLQEAQMPDGGDMEALEESIAALNSSLPLVLRLPAGNAEGVISGAPELPVEAVGVDMVSTRLETLPEPFPKTLLAGVVDSGDPEPEEPSKVAAQYEVLLDRLADEADLHLAPNGDLRALAPEDAEPKIRRLGDAARILRGG